MKQPLIVLAGPTAAGKAALPIQPAKAVGGEVISANSMQVYRHTDISSAKVTPMEMSGVPHYLIDVLDPQEPFNAVTFQQMTKGALRETYSHDRIPVIAGGAGFYIQALLYNINLKENEDDSPVRKGLEALVEREGERAPWPLYSTLRQVDSEAVVRIHANNIERVVRVIEYFRQTGERISLHNQQEREKGSPYSLLYYVLNTDRALLYERIDRRIDLMAEQGLVEKVKASRDMGCWRGRTSTQGPGYREILDRLGGRCSLEEAVYMLKRDTRRFAKRQLTQFKWEGEVHFLNLPEFGGDISKVLGRILEDCAGQGIML